MINKIIILITFLIVFSSSCAAADEMPGFVKVGIVDLKTHRVKKIVNVPLNEYVAGVISKEVPNAWPNEAKKALAVLVRSWVYSNKERHSNEGFDFCNLTHCQSWQNYDLKKDRNNIKSIIQEIGTAVLEYKGKAISGFYHSTCGGSTALAQDVFMEEYLPYLKAKWDGPPKNHNCKESPHYSWNSFITNKDIAKLLRKVIKRDTKFDFIYISQRDKLGKRAKRITVVLDKGIKLIKAYDFWMAAGEILGWNMIKSTYFDLVRKDDGYLFIGHGNGHGIGMCQWGAKKLAEEGLGYERILRFYFPKCTLLSRQ